MLRRRSARRAARSARPLTSLAGATIALLLAAPPALAQGGGDPARGAPLGDLVWGAGVATALTALLLWVAIAHRTRRITWLSRAAGLCGRVSGLPGWAALPAVVTGFSLIVAVFGFYWDVAKHIDTGRDPSPFGTPAHYPILVGLAGIALGGFVGVLLGSRPGGREAPGPTALRISRDWHVPLGSALISLCGAFALAGFPLDDVWHRLFGQDVTLWGPTHILMIGGASLSTVGVWVLLVEGGRARTGARRAPRPADGAARTAPRWLPRLQAVAIAGGFLLGLSTLQGEFDYGVPQFQLVYQPILLALAAGIGLVAARVRLGRWGALQAVAFFLVLRGALTLVIGPVLGLSTFHFPLYLAEAALVELAALRFSPERPLTLGAVSGALVGTLGLAAEWGWSHVWMPLPWPASLLPEAAVLGLAAGLAGGVIGGFVGRALSADRRGAIQRAPRWLLPVAVAVAVGCIAYPLPMSAGPATSASVTLRELAPAPDRAVAATVRLSPPDAARGAEWLTATAWQGGSLVVDRLERTGPGAYRTTRPLPVHGNWKTMLRLADGRGLRALPIYLPEDRAIPAAGVAATPSSTRTFVADKRILQREAVGGSQELKLPAYGLLLAISAAWLVGVGWGLRRLERAAEGDEDRAPGSRTAAPRAPVATPA